MSIEVWKYIPNIPEIADLFLLKFQVSNLGRVKNSRDFIYKTYINNAGYVHVTIKYTKKNYSLHRLVALTFLENPENKKIVNHINCKRDDNRVENLEFVTSKENSSSEKKLKTKKEISGRVVDGRAGANRVAGSSFMNLILSFQMKFTKLII